MIVLEISKKYALSWGSDQKVVKNMIRLYYLCLMSYHIVLIVVWIVGAQSSFFSL